MNLSTGNGIRIGRGLAAIFAALAFAFVTLAQAVTTTTVQGTVYSANGQPASGTVQISWTSFTTAAGQSIAAGTTTATIGSDGFLSVNLAPNQDASPAGLFYTVTYYLSNGATNTEYWVVPDAAQATLAQVRASVMPSSQAIQTVSKAYVDQAIANISQSGLSPTGGTLTGPLYLASDPTSSLQAADKHYVDTAIGQTVPLSGATLTGALSGPSVRASVNNVINVMAPPYNAKGDCVTDDQAAIQAALTAALAANEPVEFPPPPGGCYLTSTLTWLGQSLIGQPGVSVTGSALQQVIIQGKPGEDILNVPDPNSSASVPNRTWSVSNITFKLNDTVDASGSGGAFPHRWPGKWVGDGAMTSGSAVLTSSAAEFTCGDIGQAVLVDGAGSGGSNLSTTISSITPCYLNGSAPTVTLAASASTTVSSALVYIAVAGMPVTQQIGNCAIAMNNYDGKSSDWMTSRSLPIYDNLHNVNFTTTNGGSGGQNSSCALYFGGVMSPYGLDARNVNITNFVYGAVWGTNDTNPPGSAANNVGIGSDYMVWDQGKWQASYPWISYNGGQNSFKGIEITAKVGPQFLQTKSGAETGGARDTIEVNELESIVGATLGFRFDLNHSTFINTQLASDAGNYPSGIYGYDNQCLKCTPPLTLNLGGYSNYFQFMYVPSTVNDEGYGNSVTSTSGNVQLPGYSPTEPVAQNGMRSPSIWGSISPDFIRSGNVNTPYDNLSDLFIWPAEVRWHSGFGTQVFPDPTSITGEYGYTNGTYQVLGFANPVNSVLTNQVYNYTIGGVGAGKANVPATKIILYASVKCPAVTSYSLWVTANGVSVASATPTCSSSGYTVGSVTADLSSYAGQSFGFGIGSGSGEVDWAYVAVRPYQADYNGYQPLNKAGDTMTGPLILNADPTAALGAATKQYVDAHATGAAVLVNWGPDMSGAAGNGFLANYTVYYSIQLYGTLTPSTLRYRVQTADNTSNLYDLGIYSVSGTTATLVTDTGPVAGTTFASSTGIKTISLSSSHTLTPGVYLFAMTTNCTSSCAVLMGSPYNIFSVYTNNLTSGPSTGGQLPNTITGLSYTSATASSNVTGFDAY